MKYPLTILLLAAPVAGQIKPVTPAEPGFGSFGSINVPLCDTTLDRILDMSGTNFWLLIAGVIFIGVGLKSDHNILFALGVVAVAIGFLMVCPNYTLAALILIPAIFKMLHH